MEVQRYRVTYNAFMLYYYILQRQHYTYTKAENMYTAVNISGIATASIPLKPYTIIMKQYFFKTGYKTKQLS